MSVHTKILIFSDSHGNTRNLSRAIGEHAGSVDLILHLGDGIADLPPETKAISRVLRGNFEDCFHRYYEVPTEQLFTVAGKKILACHGHRHSIKTFEAMLALYAVEKEADIVLFGHTHVPYLRYAPEEEYGRPLHLFNPGSIGSPRGGKASYGILEISENGVLLSHRYMD